MTAEANSVLQQALRLNPVERAELIDSLFRSFDPTPDPRTDALWAEEAESRINAYDAGELQASSTEDVLKRISQR